MVFVSKAHGKYQKSTSSISPALTSPLLAQSQPKSQPQPASEPKKPAHTIQMGGGYSEVKLSAEDRIKEKNMITNKQAPISDSITDKQSREKLQRFINFKF